MEINRKRVARRLASGLLAGALAFGGLALSGAPAGAISVELDRDQRLAGVDRYNTSAIVAEELEDLAGAFDTVVIASGENYPDALAASVLAGEDAPILLVKADEIPSSVRDRMNRISRDVDDVYIVGGTSAISSTVESEIESIFSDADVTRFSGDDRYATAVSVAEEIGLDAGTFLLVSGAGFADAVSVGAWSAESGVPILLANGSGVPAATLEALEGALDEDSGTEVVIVGGPSAVSASAEETLVDLGFAPANVSRVAGADRYQTNLFWNLENLSSAAGFNKHLRDDLSLDLLGTTVLFVSGANYPDAISSAPLAAQLNAHVVLVDPTSAGASALTIASSLKGAVSSQALKATFIGFESPAVDAADSVYALQDLWVVGGTAAVAESAVTAFETAASGSLSCTISIAGANDDAQVTDTGPQHATITFAGPLTNLDSIAGEEVYLRDNIDDLIEVNGSAITSGSITSLDNDYDGFTEAFRVDLGETLEYGDEIEFVGVDEDSSEYAAAAALGLRELSACSTSVGRDRTSPIMSVKGVEGGTAAWVTFSEPMSREDNDAGDTIADKVGVILDELPSGVGLNTHACIPEGGTSLQNFMCIAAVDGGGVWGTDAVTDALAASGGLDTDDTLFATDESLIDAAGNVMSVVRYNITDTEDIAAVGIDSAIMICRDISNPIAGGGVASADEEAEPRATAWGALVDGVGETANLPWGAAVTTDDGTNGDGSADGTVAATTASTIEVPVGDATLILTDDGLPGMSASEWTFTFTHVRGTMVPSMAVDGKDATITFDRYVHTDADLEALINRSSIGSGYGSLSWSAETDDGASLMTAAQVGSYDTTDSSDEGTKGCLVIVELDGPVMGAFTSVAGTSAPENKGEYRLRINNQVVDMDAFAVPLGYVTALSAGGSTTLIGYVAQQSQPTGSVRIDIATGLMDNDADDDYVSANVLVI